MTRMRPALFLSLILLVRPVPVSAAAAGGREEGLNRVGSVRTSTPIGKVYSPGEMYLNGRRVSGEQLIWSGDLVQLNDTAAAISLDDDTKLLLGARSAIRVRGDRRSMPADPADTHISLSITRGDVLVMLGAQTAATISAMGSIFRASTGASLHVTIAPSLAVDFISGEVIKEDAASQRRRALVQPCTVDKQGKPTPIPPSTKEVPQQKEALLQVLVTDAVTNIPLVGAPVRYFLAKIGFGKLGSSEVTVLTNSFGVATAKFTAAKVLDSSPVTATTLGEWEGSFEFTIKVIPGSSGFWTRNKWRIIPIAAGAAVILIVDPFNSKDRIKAIPPPQIP